MLYRGIENMSSCLYKTFFFLALDWRLTAHSFLSFADVNFGFNVICICTLIVHYSGVKGPGWLNELGSWITKQLIQSNHQYGVSSRPAL